MHQMHSRLISLYSVSLSASRIIQRNQSHPCSGTRGYLTLQILQIPLPTAPSASLCSRRQLPYVLHGPVVSTFPGLPKKGVTVSPNYSRNHPEANRILSVGHSHCLWPHKCPVSLFSLKRELTSLSGTRVPALTLGLSEA